jgi:DNA-binding transcriptional ArsR family regulator
MQMDGLEKKVRLHRALGEPNRLKILAYLLAKKEPVCICNLSKHIKKDQSVVFRHIQQLREADLISTRKEGQYLFCSLKDSSRIRKIIR